MSYLNKIPSVALALGCAIGSSFLSAAVTTDPVGYVTETLSAGSFNVLGSNLSNEIVARGVLESATDTTITDQDALFTDTLSVDDSYFIRLISDDENLGINTTVSVENATTLVTGDNLTAFVSSTTAYEIRRVVTISDLFGVENSAELLGAQAGDTSLADIIWVPNQSGGYTKVYYNETARAFPPLSVGWKSTASGNDDASDEPVYYTSAVLVEVQRPTFSSGEAGVSDDDLTTKKVVFNGSVLTSSSQVVAETGFNYLNKIFPSALTLSESSLALNISHATQGDTTLADIVWIPNSDGGYDKYYYNGTARTFPPLSVGWKGTTSGDADASTVELSSGFLLERKGEATMVNLAIPASANL